MENYKKLIKYNNFYKNERSREILLEINKKKCKGCNVDLNLNKNYHIGHIIPQKDKEKFEKIFKGLDVNNIINLHPLCSSCNLKANCYQTYSFFMLNQMYNENLRIIENRLEKVLNKNKFKKIKIIKDFLEKNKKIDLFDKKGKKIINKKARKLITEIMESENVNKEFIKIKYIDDLKKISEILFLNKIIINNNKINELELNKYKKVLKNGDMIIKNNKKNRKFIIEYIEELGKFLYE